MGDAPTTPSSRRATWKTDAEDLVARFQAHARGEGSESFPPWRIGYMAGLADVKEVAGGFAATIHRISPNVDVQRVTIPREGRPTPTLIDALCWHFDQDVRRYDREYEERDGMWHRLPEGPPLVDPLLKVILEDAAMTADSLLWNIADDEDFGRKRKVTTTLRGRCPVGRIEITLRMNEIHARFMLPGTDVAWSHGHLLLTGANLPETALVAAHGRPLSDVVRHDLVDRAGPIRVTGISQGVDGSATVATAAAKADGMVAGPSAARKAAA